MQVAAALTYKAVAMVPNMHTISILITRLPTRYILRIIEVTRTSGIRSPAYTTILHSKFKTCRDRKKEREAGSKVQSLFGS